MISIFMKEFGLFSNFDFKKGFKTEFEGKKEKILACQEMEFPTKSNLQPVEVTSPIRQRETQIRT